MGQNFAFGWDQVRLGLSGALGDTHCSKTPLSRVVPLQGYDAVLVFDLVVNACEYENLIRIVELLVY